LRIILSPSQFLFLKMITGSPRVAFQVQVGIGLHGGKQ
jgi:hypothetical protein